MNRLALRLTKLRAMLPPPPAPTPITHDFSRLTPDQRMRLAELSDRYEAVGLDELTPDELEKIAGLVGILERRPEP